MYKTILLHVDRGAAMPLRLAVAAALAERHGAHLAGCVATGIAPRDYALAAVSPFAPPAGLPDMDDEVEAVLRHFETAVRHRGVASIGAGAIADHAGAALAARSPYADLIVVGQDCGAAVGAGIAVGIPDYVALHGACPVLMVPDGCRHDRIGRTIVVGWNGSLEAAHAAHAALPLLRDAALVRIVVAHPERLVLRHDHLPGPDLAEWLRRHGATVETVVDGGAHDAGEALLLAARNGNADLIVAGAYGHNRFRELVAGGATRRLLDNPDICVLLAH